MEDKPKCTKCGRTDYKIINGLCIWCWVADNNEPLPFPAPPAL